MSISLPSPLEPRFDLGLIGWQLGRNQGLTLVTQHCLARLLFKELGHLGMSSSHLEVTPDQLQVLILIRLIGRQRVDRLTSQTLDPMG
jgi:hypothetical protein